eukprot:scaffold434_cov358-Prasinococcus_capsulatus_cf.AAC.4
MTLSTRGTYLCIAGAHHATPQAQLQINAVQTWDRPCPAAEPSGLGAEQLDNSSGEEHGHLHVVRRGCRQRGSHRGHVLFQQCLQEALGVA